MKSITCEMSLFVLVSALSMSCASPVCASQAPVYNQRLAHVRYMPEEPMVKVLLAKDQEGLMVEVKGPHNIYDPYSGRKLDAAFMGSSYYMYPTPDGVKWGQEFPGVFQIVIVPDEPSDGVFVNGIAYPGAVAFYEIDNRLAAVNWVSIDDFTGSILSTNFLPREADQKEALAAYSIAIRSKVYQQVLAPDNLFWDLSAEPCGYRGNAVVRLDTPFKDAMKATKKIVMTGMQQSTLPANFDKKAIDEIRQQMPLATVQDMAKAGKDARIILHKFYPDQNLIVAEPTPQVVH